MEAREKRAWNRINEFRIPEWKKQEAFTSFLDYEGLRGDLIKAGYPDELDYPHTTAFIDEVKPIPDDFINIVIRWIPLLRNKQGAVSFLRESKDKYDGRVLIPIFNESDAHEKWQICDAIVYNPPLNINEWVKDAYLSKKFGYRETGLLPLAVAKMFPRDEARIILKNGFDLHPEVTPEAFGKVGLKEDISFLIEKQEHKYDKKFINKEIEKAINKIKRKYK